jgi:hypothetical protein
MAINFLNKVDLNKNELDHARIVNEAGNTAAGSGVSGQLYFDTTADSGVGVLKVWTNQWVEVGGGVESLTTTQAGNSTGNSITLLSAATGAVTVNAFAYAGAGLVGYVPSGGTNTKFLRGDASWQTVDNYVSWTADSDQGTDITITSGFNLKFTGAVTSGGAGIATDSAVSAGEMTIGLINAGGTPSATTFYRGDGQWIVPTNDLYTLGKAGGSNNLILKNDGVNQNTIAFNGTAKEIKLDVATADSYTISLADGAFAEWSVSGTNLQLPANAVAQTPASGDDSTRIATTAFVQAAVTGLLEFKGGFNANTGAIVGGGNLTTGGSRIAIAVGDYYVVTVAGNFFGNTATPLTPGDSVIVQTAAAAGASVEGDFIIVQSDTDLATISTPGIGNVNASTVNDKLGAHVVYNVPGTAVVGVDIAGLDPGGAVNNSDIVFGNNGTKNVKFNIGNIIAKSSVQLLLHATSTTGVSNQSSPPSGTQGWVINSNTVLEAPALNCGIEVMTAAGETVYADVTRSGNNITINFTAPSAIAQGAYRAIVTRA